MKQHKISTLITLIVAIITLSSCSQGIKIDEISEPVSTHNQKIKDFLLNPVDGNLNAKGDEELSKPNAVHLTWKGNSAQYTINISEHEDMSDKFTTTTNNNCYDFYNMKLGFKYYWNVQTDKEISPISTFISKEEKVRLINIDGVTNCRDLGGYKTCDGKTIKQGLLYRTGRFNKTNSITLIKNITKEGENTLKNQLGIKTEIDLREDDQYCGQAYDGYIPGVSYKKYYMQYRDEKKEPVNLLTYNKDIIKRLFEEVLSDFNNYPLVFHCSQGTDRTGCIAYTLLGLCGVDKNDLVCDYLLSNFSPILDGTPRKFTSLSDNYPKTYDDAEGSTLMEKVENVLINQCDISVNVLNKVKTILLS